MRGSCKTGREHGERVFGAYVPGAAELDLFEAVDDLVEVEDEDEPNVNVISLEPKTNSQDF